MTELTLPSPPLDARPMAMTQPAGPDDPAEKELLDQLLREGLVSAEADESPDDIARFRKLLVVLINACLLRPPDGITQAGVEQARLTLSILSQQTVQRPEILLSPPPAGEVQKPFYAWLVTRLIIAAANYHELEETRSLFMAVVDAAARVLIVLGRDLSDSDNSYIQGPLRVASALKELVRFSRGSAEGKAQTLLGYSDLPQGDLVQLIALHVALSCPTPFTSDALVSAASALSDFGARTPGLSPNLQALFAAMVSAAVTAVPVSHVLSQAALAVASLPEADNDYWHEAVEGCLKRLQAEGDPALCRDLWWALNAQAPELDVTSVVGKQKIICLLTISPPFITKDLIGEVLDGDLVRQWEQSGVPQIRERMRELVNPGGRLLSKRKRENESLDSKVSELLRAKVPELQIEGDVLSTLPRTLAALGTEVNCRLLATIPTLACTLAQCATSHQHLPESFRRVFLTSDINNAVGDDYILMRALGVLFLHINVHPLSWIDRRQDGVRRALRSQNRRTRIAAGNLVSAAYRAARSAGAERFKPVHTDVMDILSKLLKASLQIQETTILLVGDLGKYADDKCLGDILELLIKQFGSKSSPIRSLVFTQLTDIATVRDKQPYNLLSPYLDRLGVVLAECLVPNAEVVAQTMQFIRYTRQAFFTLDVVCKAVIPALVVEHNRDALEAIAAICGQRLGIILVNEGPAILAKIFLTPAATTRALKFVGELLNEAISSRTASATTVDKYLRASVVPLIVSVVVELGAQDPHMQETATRALHAIQREERGNASDQGDLGAFLKPHMLGVLATLTEQLMTPRTPSDSRRKVIRSIGKLISLVGHSMASFSPQIIASLQGTLEEPDLRKETLQTWYVFIDFLKFADVGPFIGPTIAALVAQWAAFSREERAQAKGIIKLISGNAAHLLAYRDDIVRFDEVDELAPLCKSLLAYRQGWSTREYLTKLIDRINNQNWAISTASVRELRTLLKDKSAEIMQLARGDAFDALISRLLKSLLDATTRNEDTDLRDLCYECLGIVGALDPDRLATAPEDTSMTIMSNFTDHEESVNFAIHLIRDLLTGAFRATNDTKHQKHLSFSIQELLKFCGFDQRLVGRISSVSPKIRARWEALPKDVLETITPLLDAQFKQTQTKTTQFEYPIYPHMSTYREWVQSWTVDLIGRIMEMRKGGDQGDAQAIFGAFNSEPKNQDVAVAHHLLPHLVLHVLLDGDHKAQHQIKMEILDVLRDQVSPSRGSTPDKRMLSAQVIFELMDHLSKWLRMARADSERDSHRRPVDHLLSSIDTELAANAALKSRAYARSLRNFEERIVYLRTHEKRNDTELQTYFESLHEIYAQLDEPDGMEGVSAFVVSPTLELQIREHESTGRWTSAQSCWEVRLQQSPEDLSLHVGLLRCLKNLGHYDTLRTHIRGVLSRHKDWADELAPFHAEAAWTIGDWETVRSIKNPPPIANVFLAMQSGEGVSEALTIARRQIGSAITSREYSRAYETILQLHMVREVEIIHATDATIQHTGLTFSSNNTAVINRRHVDSLVAGLAERFQTTLPSFRAREEILSRRRAAFGLVQTPLLRSELGQAWIQSAKIARKAGYEQTAYSAALQAKEAEAPFAFIQQAKLVRAHGGILKALRELQHPVQELIYDSEEARHGVIDLTADRMKTEDDFRRDRSLAKAVLLEARWSHEADRFEQNDVIRRFKKATELGETLESPFFHLGRYYDTLAAGATDLAEISGYNYFTCVNYHEALQRGVKYIYQTMPRLLTVWLDLAEVKDARKNPHVQANIGNITKLMDKSRGRIMTYQFLTAFPQMISRITHNNKDVQEVLIKLVYRVIRDHPSQALWPAVGAMQSKRSERRAVTETILKKAIAGVESHAELHRRISDARRLSTVLLQLSEDKPENTKVREASIAQKYPYVLPVFPSSMAMPLQDSLTPELPTAGSPLKGHAAFPGVLVTIIGISDRVEIMPSLQQPKKLVFKGSDGKRYPFLCKPHDDLRKDARLMDFNAMINKFLKSGSEARRRHLYIRTYAVMPLNEECGLIEWVSNTNALKSILEKGYARHKKRLYTNEIYHALDAARKSDNMQVNLTNTFKTKVLPPFRPTVFHEWFLTNWPEPGAWLSARTNYARTLAVMSMIGFVLGLGDRHGENILFDGLSGDTVHVDLNCLFDKAKTFEVPERVPFRLTHNMVDALGVTGVEGVFRKAAEITMAILRSNGDSLMSVLEAFVHDPLVEWTKSRSNRKESDVRAAADRNLKPIQKKLRGVIGETETTVPNQVEALIKQATSSTNLALMYVGWAAWL